MKAAIHLSGGTSQASGNYVVKEILRTGSWPVIPTPSGTLKRPLRIIRNGTSDAATGTIALSEVVQNFKLGAIPNVQVPLSDDERDHKNISRLNTGFVRDVWIIDEGNVSKLVAKIEFTDDDVRRRVLNGSICDVSAGIPWRVVSRGKAFGACLEHVALTNRPFVSDLGGFALAASITTDAQERAQAVMASMTGAADVEAVRSRARAVRDAMQGKVDDDDVAARTREARQALYGLGR